MPIYTDQLHREVLISHPPRRIVSLVPSQTELLAYLGLEEETAGITKFCVHPQDWFRKKQRVGGTKNINIDAILSLRPDLVIANKEENVKEQLEILEKHVPVWISDVSDLDSAIHMMHSIGEITNKIAEARELTGRISSDFQDLSEYLENKEPIDTAYLIWKDPYMTVGGDTFINDILSRCHFRNVYADMLRYPEITISSINCELLILSSEPYPFKERHREELQSVLPATKIILADGELFSWYGSRLLHTAEYAKKLLQLHMQP